jgi:hypothetical protein
MRFEKIWFISISSPLHIGNSEISSLISELLMRDLKILETSDISLFISSPSISSSEEPKRESLKRPEISKSILFILADIYFSDSGISSFTMAATFSLVSSES